MKHQTRLEKSTQNEFSPSYSQKSDHIKNVYLCDIILFSHFLGIIVPLIRPEVVVHRCLSKRLALKIVLP